MIQLDLPNPTPSSPPNYPFLRSYFHFRTEINILSSLNKTRSGRVTLQGGVHIRRCVVTLRYQPARWYGSSISPHHVSHREGGSGSHVVTRGQLRGLLVVTCVSRDVECNIVKVTRYVTAQSVVTRAQRALRSTLRLRTDSSVNASTD